MIGVTLALAGLARKKKLKLKEIVFLFDIILAIVPFGIMV